MMFAVIKSWFVKCDHDLEYVDCQDKKSILRQDFHEDWQQCADAFKDEPDIFKRYVCLKCGRTFDKSKEFKIKIQKYIKDNKLWMKLPSLRRERALHITFGG